MTDFAVDTSVAVPLVVHSHEAHESVSNWARRHSLVLSGHALVETYAVLTRLPGDARFAADDAVAVIADNFGEPLSISLILQRKLPALFAARGVAGGAVYDGLVALAAREAGLTLATRDARARATYTSLGVPIEIVG